MSNSTLSLEERRIFVTEYLVNLLKINAPKDTANLANNAITYDLNKLEIYIGGEPAPYAVYTNEPWISPKWKGKKNPNEGWIERTIEQALPHIREIFSGALSKEDIENELEAQQEAFRETLRELDVSRKGAYK